MVNVFITGATGLIGKYIIDRLIADGEYNVYALIRPESILKKSDFPAQINWVESDLFDVVKLREVISQCEYIVHAAAIVSFNPRDREEMFKTNIEGTKNLIDIAVECDVKRFVHISSVAALGKTDDGTAIDENVKWTSNEGRANYDITKFNAELEVWRGTEEGLEVNIVNPSVVLGVEDWTRSSSKLFKFVYENSRFYTEGTLNYVDVRDVADVSVRALKTDFYNERVVLCAGHISHLDFFKKVANSFSVKPPRIKIPILLLKIWQKFEAVKASLFGLSPLITKETVRSLDKPSRYNNKKGVELYDIEYRAIDDTIDWVTSSYVNKYNLK